MAKYTKDPILGVDSLEQRMQAASSLQPSPATRRESHSPWCASSGQGRGDRPTSNSYVVTRAVTSRAPVTPRGARLMYNPCSGSGQGLGATDVTQGRRGYKLKIPGSVGACNPCKDESR